MKKYILLLIVALSMNLSFSQHEKNNIGINIGPNYTSFKDGYISDNSKGSIGYFLGLSYEYFYNDNLSFITNLNLEVKSLTYKANYFEDFEEEFRERNFKNQYLYLTFPLMLKYEFPNSNSLYVTGGASVNILTAGITKLDGEIIYDSVGSTQIDVGIPVGIGKIFKLNEKNEIKLELRYDHQIANLKKEEFIINPLKANTFGLIINWNFKVYK